MLGRLWARIPGIFTKEPLGACLKCVRRLAHQQRKRQHLHQHEHKTKTQVRPKRSTNWRWSLRSVRCQLRSKPDPTCRTTPTIHGAPTFLVGEPRRRRTVQRVDPKSSCRVSRMDHWLQVIGMTLSKKIMKVPCADIPILRQPRRVEMELKKGHGDFWSWGLGSKESWCLCSFARDRQVLSGPFGVYVPDNIPGLLSTSGLGAECGAHPNVLLTLKVGQKAHLYQLRGSLSKSILCCLSEAFEEPCWVNV